MISFTVKTSSKTTSTANIINELIQIYPNPVKDIFQLNLKFDAHESGSIEIYDILGSCIKHVYLVSNKQLIDVSTFAPGSYIIKLDMGNNKYTRQIIKE